jgi:tetratricopeptide (TPR) repeat protein
MSETERVVSDEKIAETLDMQKKKDRIGEYLKPKLSGFVFGEFSDEFLVLHDLVSQLRGVPIPLKAEDLQNFAGGEGIRPDIIADNMVHVMGCDPHFKYVDSYLAYLRKSFNESLIKVLLDRAHQASEKEEEYEACTYARAALLLDPADRDAMFTYAVITHDMYEESEDAEYVGRLKAESLEYFERISQLYPDFAAAYYYLGYAYLNMGLYTKAQIVWERFVMLAENGKECEEIEERLESIMEPVKIEQACNDIMATRYEKGIEALAAFEGSKYEKWWPMHYYLGMGYCGIGEDEKAESAFRKVLTLNPSHTETMKELVRIYEMRGDKEKSEKYRNKIKLIESQS